MKVVEVVLAQFTETQIAEAATKLAACNETAAQLVKVAEELGDLECSVDKGGL